MKSLTLIVLLLSAGSLAQDTIPAGTILPLQLNSALRSTKARPGQPISARLMQDVPLPGRSSIPAGAKVAGHIVSVSSNRATAEMKLRFDTLIVRKRRVPLTSHLRALASMMEVEEAQIPATGPDRGTSEYNWTTNQIGSEVHYHSAAVARGLTVVGKSVPNGVLARPNSGSDCPAHAESDDRPQAFWVFSSDACGLYGFSNVVLVHAGRTEPFGEIILQSTKGELNVRSGSGMLLRVNGDAD
jgi:hypothetical protein